MIGQTPKGGVDGINGGCHARRRFKEIGLVEFRKKPAGFGTDCLDGQSVHAGRAFDYIP